MPAEPALAGPPVGWAAAALAADTEAVQLAIDINDFLGEWQISARWGMRGYDAETVHAYHQRFAARLVKLGNGLLAAGTPRERVSLLLDRQASVGEIGQVARYLKYRERQDAAGASGVGPVS